MKHKRFYLSNAQNSINMNVRAFSAENRVFPDLWGEENNDLNNMENEIAAIRSEEVDEHHRRLHSLSTLEVLKQREQNKWKKETENHQKTKISESQEIIHSGKGH